MGIFNKHGSRHLRPWTRNGGQGQVAFVEGDVFLPGAGVNAYKSTLGDPRFDITTLPAQNFRTFSPFQGNQWWNGLALSPQPPQGYPYGGIGFQSLMDSKDYPDVPMIEPVYNGYRG